MSTLLHARPASGLRGTFIDSVGEKGFSFLTTMVLARILKPADFWFYALLFVVIDTLGIFKNLGLDAAIITWANLRGMAAYAVPAVVLARAVHLTSEGQR